MAHLKSIWESIWGPVGVCFGVHVGPSGVHFGSVLRSDSDFRFRSDLGASLGPHVGPMLAPCWRRSGVLRGPWAFLGRSKGHLELNFDQHGKEDEKERLDFREKKNKHSKYCVFQWFLKVPKIDFG